MYKTISFILSLIVSIFLLVGCATNKPKSDLPKTIQLGPMPVVINNPSPIFHRHVWIFEGRDEVKITSVPKKDKLVFNRPPLGEFMIKPANGDNWHKYTTIYLPQNTSFILHEQPENFLGWHIGRPFQRIFSIGSNPVANTYRPKTPTMSTNLLCAYYIELPDVDSSGPSLLSKKIEININPGMYMKSMIYKIFNFFSGKK